MIYIDPPYNTGKDFIYKDNFKQSKEEYNEETDAVDADGYKLYKNTTTNGRYHSDWLSMMYERLVVAKDLLRDDGVIFISIDDNEVHNLRKICDEIFGENNYLNNFCWLNNLKGRQISGAGAAKTYEHILCYAKKANNVSSFVDSIEYLKNLMPSTYKGFNAEIESDEEGEFVSKNELHNTNSAFNEKTRPSLVFNIHYNPKTKEIKFSEINDEKHFSGFIKIKPKKNNNGTHQFHAWRWSKEKITKDSNNLKFVRSNKTYKIYTKIRDYESTVLKDSISDISTTKGNSELVELFDGKKFFDYPKSLSLLKIFINQSSREELILDFFSGSATTAHATMQLNAEDGGNRKYIMVQIPEETSKDSEAYKAGYKTISDMGKERIRRAGKKIKEDNQDKDLSNVDFGFRVFKVDSTNMKDVYYNPQELTQDNLFEMENNIKEDRTPEDLLTQVMLDLGVELSLKIEEKDILGNKVFFVEENSLIACFDKNINFKIIDEIAKTKPLKVVFRDSSFKEDKDKINLEEKFKISSPETKIKIL
jgi:adenine-specific DNA-methyltransferase